jgi:hypothetical protein
MRLKTLLVLLVFGVTASLAAAQAPPPPPAKPAQGGAAASAQGPWIGWITDTHCGKNGADKNHTADCVEKCIKGGSRPQIWNEADGKAYNLDSFEKARPFVGQKVLVRGTLNAQTNTIAVESVIKAQTAY